MSDLDAIRYLGGKRALLDWISGEVLGARRRKHVAIDLFSGSAVVAQRLQPSFHVIANDTEPFAYVLARSALSGRQSRLSGRVLARLRDAYECNLERLQALWQEPLALEDHALACGGASELQRLTEHYPSTCRPFISNGYSSSFTELFSGSRRSNYQTNPRTEPYCLFAMQFGATYFGVRQSLAIDSLRYAVDQFAGDAWFSLMAALVGTVTRLVSSPGHFAQFFRLTKSKPVARASAQRRRDVLNTVVEGLQRAPAGPKSRFQGVATRVEAVRLLEGLDEMGLHADVIYADPPYTKDQYSRFYHVLNTLVLYDYPDTKGRAAYRTERFVSDFSLKSKASTAFDDMFAAARRVAPCLVLSYSNQGLVDVATLVRAGRRHYKSVQIASRRVKHSTSGAAGRSVIRREYLMRLDR